MTNIKNKKTAWIEFTIQAAFLRGILHLLNHPPSDLKLFTKGLPQNKQTIIISFLFERTYIT